MTAGRKPISADITDVIDPKLDQHKIAGAMTQMRSDVTELALVQAQHDSAVRAVALQMGYQLPADCTDPDLIQRDISANMRRSVEACLEVGKGLRVLKEACAHGNFNARLDVLGLEHTVAIRFMQAAAKLSNAATSQHLIKAIGNQSKLFEMLVLDDAQIEELELTGQTSELKLDDIATMSVKELRQAVRATRQDLDNANKISSKKSERIQAQQDQIDRIAVLSPDEDLADLQKKATVRMHSAQASVKGELRQALIALRDHDSNTDSSLFMAGLVGQIQADLTALLEEFNLPDVSTAADQELAADVAQWSAVP